MNEQVSRLIELRRLEDRMRSVPNTKTISVVSGKGGTGKSFFSLNFAYQLSRLNKKVLLVDLDFNFSNLHLLINHASEFTLSDFFLQRKVLRELIFRYADNIHIIFGDSGAADCPKISRDILEYFFIQLSKITPQYDYVIFDSAAGGDDITLYQVNKTDYNIIVASPEPTAVMDAYVMFKLIVESTDNAKNFIVINKSDNKEESDLAYQNLSTAVRHFLKSDLTLLGVIGFDRSVYRSIVEQELLMKAYPNSMAALEISELARRFLKITQVANNNQSLRTTYF
ncbi:MAG: AAA family ATPase [Bacteroidota bacterium]